MAGNLRGGSDEAVEAVLVPLVARARKPFTLVGLLSSLLLIAGITAAVPMAADPRNDSGGIEPGDPRDALVEADGRVAGPPRLPSTTTSTQGPRPGVPVIGEARPDPSGAAGRKNTTSSTAPTTTTLAPTTTTTTSPPSPWRRTAAAPFSGRSGHEMLVTPHGVVVLGGTDDGPLTGAVYDADADTWKQVAEAPAEFGDGDWRDARFGAAWSGSRVFVSGRSGGAASYDPATDTWASLPALPSGVQRPGGIVFWSGAEVLVWGGDAEGAQRRVGLAYDPDGAGAWRRLADAPFEIGEADDSLVHAVWTGERLLVWDDSHRGWSYDPDEDEWAAAELADPEGTRVDGATVAWTGTAVLWFFGRTPDGTTPALARSYDPAADAWSTLPAPPLSGRHRPASTVLADGRVFVCCGESEGSGTRAALFDPDAEAWATTASSQHLTGHRQGAGVVASEGRAIVWGGAESGARGLTWTP